MVGIEKLVGFCCRHALAVVACFLLAGVAAGYYTAQNLKMDTDAEKLIAPTLDWRQREIRFDALFPQQNNLILVVIDGKTPELARRAQGVLARGLETNKKLFPIVRQSGGGEFFEHNGLLYLPTAQVKSATQQLVAAQGFLGGLAADPTLRGVMDNLATALMGVAHGQATLQQLDPPMKAFASTLENVADGKPVFLSWQSLVGSSPNAAGTRSFLEVQPKLDFTELQPGAAATAAVRKAARDLHLTAENGVTIRLTGPVPLADEEFGTLADRAELMGIVMLLAVTLTLWLAVHSFKIIGAILITVFTGLALTMGLGLAAVGTFNIISFAFVALFVGLGVDFAIQFSVRYRSERHLGGDLDGALMRAGHGVGKPVALAAAATAVGFFSFLPTNYVGVAELGLIAGIGMVVAFILAVMMLPALLMLFNPPGEKAEIGFVVLAPADRFLLERRWLVIGIAGLAALASLASIPFVHFDFDPFDLRSHKVESVSTYLDLIKDPQTSPNNVDVLLPSLAQANALAARLSQVPEVGQALTLNSFVPEDQAPKLAMIKDTSFLLDAALNPFMVKPPGSDAETVASFRATATALRAAAARNRTAPAADALRLAKVLDRLASASPAIRQRADAALIPGLNELLTEMRNSLQAAPVTLQTMPAELKSNWVAKDGTARVQVFPKDTSGSPEAVEKFMQAVTAVAPQASGAPIEIHQSGVAILGAFTEAGILAFIAITILLFIALRRVHDVALAIVPLLLSGVLTLATCVLIGMPLNFANVIALPLLLGIGVAFDIYFVVAWRNGQTNLLESSLTRAVLFSALTTASGFGTLWLSSHPGTASMGELLMISLGWTLITTLFFLPALLGPPPKATR